jgi:hypothetical protein
VLTAEALFHQAKFSLVRLDRAKMRAQARGKRACSGMLTVLVVEDNVSNFVLIARMLGYMGIHCEWKTSGYEVVEYADALPQAWT